MAYDYHRPGTSPGPVAPLAWVEANIQNTLQTVPPEKLWLGIPGYGYRWRSPETRPVALMKSKIFGAYCIKMKIHG
jgi:spore germination protein YaaH